MQTVFIKTRYGLGVFVRETPNVEELQTRLLEEVDLPGDYVKSIEFYPAVGQTGEGEIMVTFATYAEALANMI